MLLLRDAKKIQTIMEALLCLVFLPTDALPLLLLLFFFSDFFFFLGKMMMIM